MTGVMVRVQFAGMNWELNVRTISNFYYVVGDELLRFLQLSRHSHNRNVWWMKTWVQKHVIPEENLCSAVQKNYRHERSNQLYTFFQTVAAETSIHASRLDLCRSLILSDTHASYREIFNYSEVSNKSTGTFINSRPKFPVVRKLFPPNMTLTPLNWHVKELQCMGEW